MLFRFVCRSFTDDVRGVVPEEALDIFTIVRCSACVCFAVGSCVLCVVRGDKFGTDEEVPDGYIHPWALLLHPPTRIERNGTEFEMQIQPRGNE